ncbi:MAG TPA: universal stress protein [Methylomirabilota bacterium]|jgi:nucleotide-binding universal stress UspA family protein|nr:universal stress protein [Methylomirabilota bacterium]
MFRKILVAYDGSEGSRRALRTGIEIARRFDAELYTLSVMEHLPHYAATVGEVKEAQAEFEEFFRNLTKQARDLAALQGVELETLVKPGHEVETIVTYAKEGGFDLLVVGFVGHSNIWGRIMGSTTQNLSRLAPCSVMIVK